MNDLPTAVAFATGICDHCDLLHMALMDQDGDVLAVISLNDEACERLLHTMARYLERKDVLGRLNAAAKKH